jgi:drug/metabolite transporter (DMT)-like permease
LLLGGTQAAVLVCETDGVGRTSATNAGLLISLCIVLTPVLDGISSRRWLPARFFLSSAIALAGTTLLVRGSGLAGFSTGDALMLAAAVLRALHVTASGHLTRDRAFDSATLTFVQLLVGAALFTWLAGSGVLRAVHRLDAGQWFAVAYLAGGCSVFAFLVQLWAVRRTSASRASLLLATEPIWAVMAGVGLGGDSLGPSAAAGAALIVAGTSWGQRVEAGHRAAPVQRRRITPGGPQETTS